ncbi:hypothetical protein CLOSTMETH_03887 [[Clostridium] methylpentosum DSM 5476]|uniref:Uncharacterized protein n=1 Tax=[Clostridium] methylpentosum DSM 5476 TaxID=537013 RepID=C0EJ41_9FIRM|nr:hypothetical protein CLOSTMETH_03887 [[Clostridium] methylpentosum DSM 5476]
MPEKSLFPDCHPPPFLHQSLQWAVQRRACTAPIRGFSWQSLKDSEFCSYYICALRPIFYQRCCTISFVSPRLFFASRSLLFCISISIPTLKKIRIP